MTTGGSINRDELGEVLFAARESAGISQKAAADATGLTQNKMSRVEHKQGHVLTPAEARALLTLYGVHGEERARILAMLEAARTEHVDARVILQKGAHLVQERFRVLAERSRQVRSFVPNAAIGYLQTAAYIRIVMTERMTDEQAEPAIQSRLGQQRLLVEDPSRQWVMVQTESGLKWNVGGAAVMAEQAERIAAAVDLPNVRLGVIPWHTAADLLPRTGFHIYDRSTVVVGTWSGTAFIRNSEDIEMYERLFDRVSRLAVFGDDAHAVLSRIAGEYRALGHE
jgi:transcriptional regulator with XRE-family HTH domain